VPRWNGWLDDTPMPDGPYIADVHTFDIPPTIAACVRNASPSEQKAMSIKQVADQIIRDAGLVPPVDRDARTLADGSPVTDDHRDLRPDGQQKAYVVLSEDERKRGFVRPYRDAYRHLKCGKITTMGRAIAETYARDPSFYSGTFCTTCKSHFPIGEDGEFTWYEMDGREGPKVGT